MDRIKNTLIGITIVVLLIIVPVSIFTDFLNLVANGIKWVVFIDNAETGLPLVAEVIIKAIVEGLITIIAIYNGYNNKSILTTILSIVLGFVACVIIYFVAKYIVWILIALVAAIVTYIVIRNVRKKKNIESSMTEGEQKEI